MESTHTTLGVMQEAITILKSHGVDATLEYPGCIVINDPASSFNNVWFGTANETWNGSDVDGNNGGVTDMPSTSQDASAIAEALLKIVKPAVRS
jgi:hypothetical protein